MATWYKTLCEPKRHYDRHEVQNKCNTLTLGKCMRGYTKWDNKFQFHQYKSAITTSDGRRLKVTGEGEIAKKLQQSGNGIDADARWVKKCIPGVDTMVAANDARLIKWIIKMATAQQQRNKTKKMQEIIPKVGRFCVCVLGVEQMEISNGKLNSNSRWESCQRTLMVGVGWPKQLSACDC